MTPGPRKSDLLCDMRCLMGRRQSSRKARLPMLALKGFHLARLYFLSIEHSFGVFRLYSTKICDCLASGILSWLDRCGALMSLKIQDLL